MYHVQQVDEGYQIFRSTTVQEYPPEVRSDPVEEEPLYPSREAALTRLQELSRQVRQRLGRVVEITVQCDTLEHAQSVQAACLPLLEPLQEMLEFLTFTDAASVPASEEQPHGVVHFLMRLLEPLTHAEVDEPLRDLLGRFLRMDGVTRVAFSFRVVEFTE